MFTVKTIKLKKLKEKSIATLKKHGWRVFLSKTMCYIKYFIMRKISKKRESYSTRTLGYQSWINNNEPSEKEGIKKKYDKLPIKPKISIIVPVYNVVPKYLNECIQSVVSQTYENWELCLYDDASTDYQTLKCLNKWQQKGDPRIKIELGKINKHISGASNEALKMATGQFIGLLDNDDTLSPNALYEVVQVLQKNPKIKFIYSDEDKITKTGKRFAPFFKPDFSPIFLETNMYTGHFGVYHRDLVKKLGGFREGFEGSQDHDLVLRITDQISDSEIHHIPKILYHWRILPTSTASNPDSKKYTTTSAKKALEDHMKRNNYSGEIFPGLYRNSYRIKNRIPKNTKVSIIIPFKDQAKMLDKCVQSILKKTKFDNYEIILVDNQSQKTGTIRTINGLKKVQKIRILHFDHPFNFSAINNFAAKEAKGNFLLFLNNDTEVINSDWLSALLEIGVRESIGAVGAKLLFKDNRVQHAGVVMGLGGITGHAFKYFNRNDPGYFGMASAPREVSAVTGACLLIKKDLFLKIGGFNEKDLPISYNDVDLCLRIQEHGLRVIYTPYSLLYHYESISRGNDADLKIKNPEMYKRVIAEENYMYNKWGSAIKNDPYYNQNLTRIKEDFSLRFEKDEN